VNSYAGGCTFAELIRRASAVPGLRRIRFTTSHPMDLSPELVRCFLEVPQLMPHFHLPVQHGADTVLERMRRRYTVAEYEERIAALPEQVALTSDIICGFPGESEDEHRQNLEFLRRTPYDNLFSFVYSPRPHTGAILKLEEWGEVPRAVALRRLEEVQRLQMERTLSRRRARVGGTVEVLAEEPGFGRSRENWTVHFRGDAAAGDLLRVRVEGASLASLRGVQVETIDRAPRPERAPPRRLTVVSA
jgi:tRNA-2-methylthio-N6-dimethylallyladenosine synthase